MSHFFPPDREVSANSLDSGALRFPPGPRRNGAASVASAFSSSPPSVLSRDPILLSGHPSISDVSGDPLGALVRDNVRLNAEIAEARRQADSALRARDNLVATLAHELRGPLAPIVSSLKIMELQDDARFQRERRVIERQTAHLARLVDDLLDVAHAVRGKVQLRRERVGLRAVLASAVEIANPVIEARRHQLQIHLPADELYIDADHTRLAQVFANLLINAARYTPEGGEIALWAAAEGAQCCVAVKDNGQGIAAEVLPRIFDLFYQESPDLARTTGGLGIGLALVKNFVGLHGGSVSVRSEGKGHGSEFIVRLPLVHVHQAWMGADEALTPASVRA